MQNAIGILKYLYDLNDKKPIRNVYWGYRAKPKGVSSSHKGDLFIEFTDGKMLGVSLKAGKSKTKEPQLNSYVKPVLEKISSNPYKSMQELESLVYNNVHKLLGFPPDWKSKQKYPEYRNKLIELAKNDEKTYELMYNKMLEIVRNFLIKEVNKEKEGTISFISTAVLGEDYKVPLVVIKAVNNGYQKIEDSNKL
jgi:hypothetical protein